jgi:hypothetical protein
LRYARPRERRRRRRSSREFRLRGSRFEGGYAALATAVHLASFTPAQKRASEVAICAPDDVFAPSTWRHTTPRGSLPSSKKKHNAGAPSNAAVVVVMIEQNRTMTASKIAFRSSVPSYSRACGAESIIRIALFVATPIGETMPISAMMAHWIPKSASASAALANPNGCNGNTRINHAERIID